MDNILLIGGTDPSGAGLQTDWKVINTLEVQAVSVVTAVTAQNSTGVLNDGVLPYAQIKAQFDALKGQTFTAIKIGMLGNDLAVKAVVNFLAKQDRQTVVILDPVLSASSGGKLLNYKGQLLLLSKLLPHVSVLTPNIEELGVLSNLPVSDPEKIQTASHQLIQRGVNAVFVTGGDFSQEQNKSIDTFISTSGGFYLVGERWQNRSNVRGTGCVLATAIAAFVAKGYSLIDALVRAKGLTSQGIKQAIENDQQLKFHFTHKHSGDSISLAHFPSLVLRYPEPNYNFSSCDTKSLGIYPVIDSVDWLKKLVPLGIKTIQLRIKDKQDNEVEADIIEAIDFCKNNSTRLFINDYWQLAIKHKAYGIHLGQEDLASLTSTDLQTIADAGCRLGISTHSYAEVARTLAIKPSYMALGPIFETTSKDMPWIPQGVDAVANWVKLLGDAYPLVAIGGINFERAKALKKTGVGSVAMISAITKSNDYEKATNDLLTLWEQD